jgi:predicted phosphodiesterase
VRIAVLSDVHSNLEALDAVLARASDEGATAYFVLGDIVGYGADPDAVVERLTALPNATLLAGNHDLAATARFDVSWFNGAAASAMAWTVREMRAETLAALEPLAPRASVDGRLLVHGSVVDPAAEYVRRAEQAARSFDAEDFSLCFFGHTHRPTIFSKRDAVGSVEAGVLRDGETVTIEGRAMCNPGSVGQPRDGDPRASFAIYEPEARAIAVHRVEYDVRAAQEKIRAAGLDAMLADRLEEGR